MLENNAQEKGRAARHALLASVLHLVYSRLQHCVYSNSVYLAASGMSVAATAGVTASTAGRARMAPAARSTCVASATVARATARTALAWRTVTRPAAARCVIVRCASGRVIAGRRTRSAVAAVISAARVPAVRWTTHNRLPHIKLRTRGRSPPNVTRRRTVAPLLRRTRCRSVPVRAVTAARLRRTAAHGRRIRFATRMPTLRRRRRRERTESLTIRRRRRTTRSALWILHAFRSLHANVVIRRWGKRTEIARLRSSTPAHARSLRPPRSRIFAAPPCT